MTGRVDTGSSYRLAVSAEMVFVDLRQGCLMRRRLPNTVTNM